MTKTQRILVVIVGSAVLVFTGVFYLMTEREVMKQRKNALQKSSNIQKAVSLRDWRDEFAPELRVYGVETYEPDMRKNKDFLDRIKRNKELASACLGAKDAKVTIFTDRNFNVGVGWVSINIGASDEEIIGFLSN